MPDASMLSQLQTIERSFWQHEQFTDESIKNLRHPTKKGVTAVDVSDRLLLSRDCPCGALIL